uniref:Putative secreted protein n=1 Tax=Ixodes scapularis TaxID=6945 RepID=A0A4D5RYM1_IXOSC
MRAGMRVVFVTILWSSTVFPLPIPLRSGSTQGVKAALRVCLEVCLASCFASSESYSGSLVHRHLHRAPARASTCDLVSDFAHPSARRG